MNLRDYQTQAITDLRASVRAGSRAPLFVLPCGGGKTAVAAELISSARQRNHDVAFLAPRRELVHQASQRLETSGIPYGVIMSGEEPWSEAVQVVSIDTLHARAFRSNRMDVPPAGLVIVDEAHVGVGGKAQSIIEHYRESGARIVGLTATPARSDGVGLGAIYDDMVEGPNIRELIDMGYLVQPVHFRGATVDVEGVDERAGDYVAKQLDDRVRDPVLVGEVVSNWHRLASSRQTFVFCHNRAHSRHLCEEFRQSGVNAAHLDGDTEKGERQRIFDGLHRGEIQVVCNVEVYTYGVDFPPVSCIVMARPTKSIARYLQAAGRGLRTAPGKFSCMVLDHAGVTRDCGFVDDVQPWSLDGKERIQDRKEKPEKKEPKEMECPQCQTVFRAAKACPNCGQSMVREHQKAVEELQAELVEIDRKERKAKSREWTRQEKAAFYAELLGYCRDKCKADGYAAHLYREKLGVWPAQKTAPVTPSPQTRSWITSRNIRQAKRREKQEKVSHV